MANTGNNTFKDIFIDGEGFLYIWQKLIARFVSKENGKGLSSNDYTTADKEKLAGIETGANKTVIENNLTSESTDHALSAKQGKVLSEKINSINTNMENLGAGDMLKSVYDTNNNNQVDKSDDADKLGGQAPAYYAKASDIPTKTSQLTNDSGFLIASDIADLAPGEHTHTSADITDFTEQMAKKANATHTHSKDDITGLANEMQTLTEIANGKKASYVFDTEDDMKTFVGNEANAAKLQVGDAILIRATDVPDYWWDGTTYQIMETRKFELATLTNSDIDAIIVDAEKGV